MQIAKENIMEISQKLFKGSEFSESLFKKLGVNASLDQYFKIIPVPREEIDFDVDGSPMSPESAFKPEFIEAVETSRKEVKRGLAKEFENTDDLFNHLDNL